MVWRSRLDHGASTLLMQRSPLKQALGDSLESTGSREPS
jgi:hypothetical protein